MKSAREEYDALLKDIADRQRALSEGEMASQENTRRVIESMASLSDINMNKGSLSAEKARSAIRRPSFRAPFIRSNPSGTNFSQARKNSIRTSPISINPFTT